MSTNFFIPTPIYMASLDGEIKGVDTRVLSLVKPSKVSLRDLQPKQLQKGLTKFSINSICEIAEIKCAASGEWIYRNIFVGFDALLKDVLIYSEPGDWARVLIKLPLRFAHYSLKKIARELLIVLAYGVFDPVARESIKFEKLRLQLQGKGADLSLASPPVGRPRKAKPLSNAERQRRFRKNTSKTK